MTEKKLTPSKFKKYLQEHLKEREGKDFNNYYFNKLDKEFVVDKNIETDIYGKPVNDTFVYSAKDASRNDLILYKITSIDPKKNYANVISHDYGFSTFYLDSLALIHYDVLQNKHSIDSKTNEEIIIEDKKKRKIKRKK